MIAVLLVGGEGTRLRPLTEWLPKPMLPIANRPFLEHQIEHLRLHGVKRVVMACGYLHQSIRDHFGDDIDYRVEPEPLGTGGAIRFAAEGIDETFVACNGDVLTDLDLTAQLRQHRERGARATLALHGVDDSSPYGLVETDGRRPCHPLRREGGERAGHHQRRHLRARAGRARPDRAGPGGVGRARGVPAPDRRRPVRARRSRPLARHRHPGQLSAREPRSGCRRAALVDATATVVDRAPSSSTRWSAPARRIAAGARLERSVVLPGATVPGTARHRERVIGIDGEPVW